MLPCSLNESFSEGSEFFIPLLQSERFPWPRRKEKYPVLRTDQSLTNLIGHTKISFLLAFLVFSRFSCSTYWNGLHGGTSRLRYLESSETVLVWYLLLGIHTIVYSCTECGKSRIYLGFEDNRSSFFWENLKSKNTDAHPQTVVLFCLRNMFLRKQKLDVKQLKMNKFIFDAR